MDKKDFEILMNSLYSNNQLFIPQGQNIKEWIDNAFVEKQEEAINYTRCCESDSELLCDCKEQTTTLRVGFNGKSFCEKCGRNKA